MKSSTSLQSESFGKSFQVGDLVLREVTLNTKEENVSKLEPTWEGPYELIKVHGKGAYSRKSVADLVNRMMS